MVKKISAYKVAGRIPFRIFFRGAHLRVEVKPGEIVVRNESDVATELTIFGQTTPLAAHAQLRHARG
ncbi:MAG: hypothetical protein IPO35_09475 [Uliginosibacterium sp.]|nr:hypothetical protein [Uliginosibacterium sp.]